MNFLISFQNIQLKVLFYSTNFQELFLTNSLIGVWPVKAIRDADSTQAKQWSVPGAVTRRLAGSMSHPLQQRMIADAAEADQ